VDDYLPFVKNEIFLVKKDGKYSYIKYDGTMLPWYKDAGYFRSGRAPVVNMDGKWGFIDPDGKLLTEWFDWLYFKFDDGITKVERDGKCTYMDTTGFIFPNWYDAVRTFMNDYDVSVVRTGDQFKLVNIKGQELTPWYEAIETVYDDDFEGYPVIKKEGKSGYIDTEGKVIVEPVYDKAFVMKNGRAKVVKDGKYAFINTEGETLSEWQPYEPPPYTKVDKPSYQPGPGTSDYNIVNYGAVGDGQTMNTKAIQAAIDACTKTGGRVVVPPGVYLTGAFRLYSRVELHVMHGAQIKGSPDIDDYHPKWKLDNGGEYLSLIFADSLVDAAITGNGLINYNGDADPFKELYYYREPSRPKGIVLRNCKNLKVEDITFRNSVCHMFFLNGENIRINNFKIWNYCQHNNDGIDIINCRNLVMTNSIIDSDDDAICFKTTTINENISISNCVVSSNCNPIKFGTGTSGIARHINFDNIVVKPTESGKNTGNGQLGGLSALAIEQNDGEGEVYDINFNNISIHGVLTPIFIRLSQRTPPVGLIRDIKFSNITASYHGKLACNITAIPGYYVENLMFHNITIIAEGGGTAYDRGHQVPEVETWYPETIRFNPSVPAYGFYVDHAKNVRFTNIDLHYQEEDVRPGIYLDDVHGASLRDVRMQKPSGNSNGLYFMNSSQPTEDNIRFEDGSPVEVVRE
jgi:hypothetical protein